MICPSITEDLNEISKYPFLDRVQEYTYTHWADHTAGSRHLRRVYPLDTMLRESIMDAPEVASPWFMYWNSLATYMELKVKPSITCVSDSWMPRWNDRPSINAHFPYLGAWVSDMHCCHVIYFDARNRLLSDAFSVLSIRGCLGLLI